MLSSPENSKKGNTEKKHDTQSKQHTISKDISERELNSQIYNISRIKDRKQDQCPKRNQFFNSQKDYIGSKIEDPKLENEGDRKGSAAGEKGERKRTGEKKQNEEGPKGGVMLGEAATTRSTSWDGQQSILTLMGTYLSMSYSVTRIQMHALLCDKFSQ